MDLSERFIQAGADCGRVSCSRVEMDRSKTTLDAGEGGNTLKKMFEYDMERMRCFDDRVDCTAFANVKGGGAFVGAGKTVQER